MTDIGINDIIKYLDKLVILEYISGVWKKMNITLIILGIIMIFFVGYKKRIFVLQKSSVIFLSVFIISYFLFPGLLGFVGSNINIQQYYFNIIFGVVSIIVFIILLNKKITCQNCGNEPPQGKPCGIFLNIHNLF